MPSPQTLTLSSGHHYTYTHTPPSTPSAPTFLLLHGFPSTPLIWTHLTPHLLSSSYGTLTLLLPGTPPAPTLSTLATHIAQLLHHLSLPQVIAVGHDWGAALLTRLWWSHPEALSALVFMSVPYQLPTKMDLEAMNGFTREVWGYEAGGYWGFLTAEGAGEVLKKNTRSALSIFYSSDERLWREELCPPGRLRAWVEGGRMAPREEWMGEGEMEGLVEHFEKEGWEGGLEWYRAAAENAGWEEEREIAGERVVVRRPVTFVVGERDAVGRADVAVQMAEKGRKEGYLPDVEVEVMKGVAHWMMLEAPEETFRILDKVAKKVSDI